MAIKIGSLTRERREGKATLTFDEQGEVRTEEIRISFLKPTETVWTEVNKIAEDGKSQGEKSVLVAQLLRVDLQSPDITNEDGTVHQITDADLRGLDVVQLKQLIEGIEDHFFLQTPVSTSETSTSSTSAPAAA